MIENIQDLPDKVIAVRISGVVKGEDYDKVLIPAINDKVRKYGKVRLLYQLDQDFEKFSRKAMMEDLKLDVHNFNSFEKVAMVSDVNWVNNAMELFKYVIPGEVKIYSNEQLPEAKDWISK